MSVVNNELLTPCNPGAHRVAASGADPPRVIRDNEADWRQSRRFDPRASNDLACGVRARDIRHLGDERDDRLFRGSIVPGRQVVGRWLIGANGRANAQRDENKEKRDEIRHPSHFSPQRYFEIFNSKLRTWFGRKSNKAAHPLMKIQNHPIGYPAYPDSWVRFPLVKREHRRSSTSAFDCDTQRLEIDRN